MAQRKFVTVILKFLGNYKNNVTVLNSSSKNKTKETDIAPAFDEKRRQFLHF